MIYKVKDLVYSYNKKDIVLNKVNLELNQGELLCVLGKNGSGKSTLFKCLLKILKVNDGQIFLNDENINNLKEKDIAKTVSYVAQGNETTFNFTVFEYILMGLAADIKIFSHPGHLEESKVMSVLEKMNLTKLKDRAFNELSGGEKQQVAIARAIVKNPSVIIFDEPTAFLDYANQIKVLKMIKELLKDGYSIIISTHDPNEAILLDGSVALIDEKGNLEKGSVKKMISERKLKKIYGTDLKIKYVEEFKRNVCIYQM